MTARRLFILTLVAVFAIAPFVLPQRYTHIAELYRAVGAGRDRPCRTDRRGAR